MADSRVHREALTVERVRELLDYDPETGILRWKVRVANCMQSGEVAGCLQRRGYTAIKIKGIAFRAHLVAWAHYYGEWPETELDHRDLNKSNNRISNLRLATRSQNCANKKVCSRNTSGIKGVYWNKKSRRWIATICINRRNKYLGGFLTKDEAASVYAKAASIVFGEFSHIS